MEFSLQDREVIRAKQPSNLLKVPFGGAVGAGNQNGIDLRAPWRSDLKLFLRAARHHSLPATRRIVCEFERPNVPTGWKLAEPAAVTEGTFRQHECFRVKAIGEFHEEAHHP
jgi:hypothetical protein